MWYLIGVVAIVLASFFIYASIRHNKCQCKTPPAEAEDKPVFRTKEDLNTYDKPMDDKHSRVDFDDAE